MFHERYYSIKTSAHISRITVLYLHLYCQSMFIFSQKLTGQRRQPLQIWYAPKTDWKDSLDRNNKNTSYWNRSKKTRRSLFIMEKWEYRTLNLSLQTVHQGKETHEDYVITYSDGTRLEGLEMVMRRYLDDGGWDLVSIVPTAFRIILHTASIATTLTVIFRRKFLL